ncbi:MAG: MaoC family dehydratase [Halobacteriales archaeon]|nr:MaoC family dehydratase [Halobacteriales archaeon]
MKYYEDYEKGETKQLGSFSLTEDEIVEFAEKFDPLWLHVDKERIEKESPFGGIIASGWHSLMSCHRLLVKGDDEEIAALGSPGVEEVSWKLPVYPGDEITVTSTVVDKRVSEKIPDRGLVKVEVVGENDDGNEVLSYLSKMYFGRRNAGEDTPKP